MDSGSPHRYDTGSSTSAVDELRERMLRIITGMVLWVGTPLLAFAQTMEAVFGRYDYELLVQAVCHVVVCTLVLSVRDRRLRVAALLAYMLWTAQLIFLHYGPTLTHGLVFFAALLLAQTFFSWRGMVAVLAGMTVSFVGGAVYFVGFGAPSFSRDAQDLMVAGTWLRVGVVALVVSTVLASMLAYFQVGLERSVRDAELALARERREREERERLEVERRRTERALAESQRQELIGRLAAGAAHDLNNILMAIMGGAELAEVDLEDDDLASLREDLSDIRDAAQRGSAVGRQLLSFSRQQATQRRNIAVDELFSGLAKLLRRLLPSNIELRLEVADDSPSVVADPAQLEQVVMNLVVNARDAMSDGGTIEVSAGPGHGPSGTPGLRLEVRDTGHGIPSELLDRIFDPFFTTKEGGRGTGLGLATVRTITEDCGGAVAVESEVNRGTTFRIWLPASETGAASETERGAEVSARARDGESVLVADDDAEVRRLAARMLTGAGYRVTTVQDGDQTLEYARRQGFNLVVLDAVMPGLSGVKLVEALEQARPDLRILFSTGYDPGVFGANFFADGRRRLLSKPYRRQDLLAAVRAVLDDADESASDC